MTEPEWPTTGSASIRIAASPEAAYDYVTDLATLPTLSPENQRCEFIEGSTEIVEGALFRGFNENGGYEWNAEFFGWPKPYPDVGGLSDEREAIESLTDRLHAPDFETLSDDERAELRELAKAARGHASN